ncbi:hypothetical protein E5163_14785 [Marinicauda algicola]|uniref:Uncharacterized protein n=1 Tax=Marinicauda algicola TaxID=2029849 RepID=A0A4S2GWV8_9PROT|nr:hypothetical protein [Marinicauda algicola]TGY87331.1 hypothetical protein E5163_14785 [Marinicauda algicola]
MTYVLAFLAVPGFMAGLLMALAGGTDIHLGFGVLAMLLSLILLALCLVAERLDRLVAHQRGEQKPARAKSGW